MISTFPTGPLTCDSDSLQVTNSEPDSGYNGVYTKQHGNQCNGMAPYQREDGAKLIYLTEANPYHSWAIGTQCNAFLTLLTTGLTNPEDLVNVMGSILSSVWTITCAPGLGQ